MLRNRNGSRYSDGQIQELMENLQIAFESNEAELTEYGLVKEDYKKFSKFLYLANMKSGTLENNFIRETFIKAQNRVYRLSKKDPDHNGKSPIEKNLITLIKKRYKDVLLDKKPKASYNVKKILRHCFLNFIRPVEFTDEIKRQMYAFQNNHYNYVKDFMTNIRVRVFKYKNTIAVQKFIDIHTRGFYENKIDTDTLIKYMSITGNISASEDGMKFLSELIHIITKNPTPMQEEVVAELLEEEND